MNYYTMLGVEPTASPDDIKSAFRAKAKQSHPDHGGSEEQFKQLNEAYDTLKDPHKRAAYDHSQTHMGSIHINVNGKQHDIFTDVFRDLGDVFGNSGPFARAREYQRNFKNKDLSIAVKMRMAESLIKQDKTIKVRQLDGESKLVKITVPAGTMHGDTVRYNGLGDASNPEQPPGSLFINVVFEDIGDWHLEGCNTVVDCTINALDAIIGTSVTVYSVDGKQFTVNVPPGTQYGTVMRIPQKGLLNKKTGLRGDLKVVILTQIPTTLSEEELNIIRGLR